MDGQVQIQNMGECFCEIDIANWRRIDKVLLKVRTESGHAIKRVRSIEAAMHALSLLQGSVAEGNRVHQRIGGFNGKAPEINNKGGSRYPADPFQVDVIES